MTDSDTTDLVKIPEWMLEYFDGETQVGGIEIESILNAFALVNTILDGQESFEQFLEIKAKFEKMWEEENDLFESSRLREKGRLN
jgi:hypothetical protein